MTNNPDNAYKNFVFTVHSCFTLSQNNPSTLTVFSPAKKPIHCAEYKNWQGSHCALGYLTHAYTKACRQGTTKQTKHKWSW